LVANVVDDFGAKLHEPGMFAQLSGHVIVAVENPFGWMIAKQPIPTFTVRC
jgi:hypothetical protein